jgi:hypothetical protein
VVSELDAPTVRLGVVVQVVLNGAAAQYGFPNTPTVEVVMNEQLVAARYVEGSIDFIEMVMLVAKHGFSLERTLSWAQSANGLVF